MTPRARPTQSLAEAMAERPLTLDGGVSSQLERLGHDLSSNLWSARLLKDDPESVIDVHLAFLQAGADITTTVSYQASYEGMADAGISATEATTLLRRSVELAREASSRFAADQSDHVQVPPKNWVAASVGPYGAFLADGSEYRGDYRLSLAQLRAFHRPRLGALAEAEPDVIAVETVPQLRELEAVLIELEGLGIPGWLSVTVDGDRLRSGEPAAEAFAMLRGLPHVIAGGINCSAPHDATNLVGLAAQLSGRPVVVYPNSGESWDPTARTWRGQADFDSESVTRWLDDGARIVGGCCRVGPTQIKTLAATVRGHQRAGV